MAVRGEAIRSAGSEPPNPEHRAQAFRERIYGVFTGLAVLISLAIDPHETTALRSFLVLAASILGITLAGYTADRIGFQVAHRRTPDRVELRRMAFTTLGALGASGVPLVALAAAGFGLFSLEIGLRVGIGMNLLALGLVLAAALFRGGLGSRQAVGATVLLVGSAAVVVGVLIVAHLL